jgi:cellulose synthase/poly-beta-1,6-N-acetylglucosamine synthase-like glycosyltransferase
MWTLKNGIENLEPLKENYEYNSFSILIPARNEEKFIEKLFKSLENLDYPKDKYEIIFINDRSNDKTQELAEKFGKNLNNFRLIHQKEVEENISPKKSALIKGIKQAKNDIILTTDADCTVLPTWIKEINKYYLKGIDVVAAPVTFRNYKFYRLFMNLQVLDFLSLITTAAGAIGSGKPVIASGANFSYRKFAFEKVGGFDGHLNVASGDDDLLLHKFTKENLGISYAWDSKALVTTTPVESFKAFVEQRKRWGSKGAKYENTIWKMRLFGIYFFHFFIFFAWILGIFNFKLFITVFFAILLKFFIDIPLMKKAIKLVEQPKLWLFSPFFELFQIPYVTITGLLANISSYKWK